MSFARRRGWAMAALLSLAACGGSVAPPVALPPEATVGFADPARQAIIVTAYSFGRPSSLAGQPAEAARVIGQAEFLAVELATGQRWIGFAPYVAQEFAAARREWRGVIGIAPEAPPQAVIDALFATRGALLAGDRRAAIAALSPTTVPGGGEGAVQRLAALPPLPLAARAASDAESEMWRESVQIDVEP
ncbi:hypothetical protein GXW74_17600 [Roseomonas eburnea]|uniref:Uncharacterized protein n=1 Tax=Neoroseomonas eburnea TaxID=1346889 RepID=A0A9X9XF25_9PROT|nr:hypothetical protein [Neoroseomonas eburnea]MBR0682311.1 hypothetical protein [Neoroseomonas eburnea]